MMKKYVSTIRVLLLVVFILGTLSSCAKQQVQETRKVKLAVVLAGVVQDADYNTVAYVALSEIGREYKIDTAYSEKVAVPDVKRVIQEYINEGYNVIWIHGAQFNGATLEIGDTYPDVTFIIEVDEEPAVKKPNFWYVDRNWWTGWYIIGALGALQTKTNLIAYIGGVELPYTVGEINAARQAIKDLGSPAEIKYLFVGDYNDPVKARQAAEGLISQGVDVILSSINLGNYGIYSAVQEAKSKVFVTTKFTSKEVHIPKNYLTSDLFNYTPPMKYVIEKVIKGEKGGYLFLKYGKDEARYTDFPIRNVTDEVQKKVSDIADKVSRGEIKIEKNQTKIQTGK